MLSKLLEGNKKFVGEVFEKDKKYFEALAKAQKPFALWIGCSDSRVPESVITQCKPGELFVHRNIGNIVALNDWNLSAVLEYAIKHLGVSDIIICGHYACGAMKALDSELEDSYISSWLLNARAARERVEEKLKVEGGERGKLIVEENVLLQLEHLREHPVVKSALKQRKLHLHGWVYDIYSGRIKVIVD
ncbi:MAG: carbonic anhydrase [Methanocellales archaeon]